MNSAGIRFGGAGRGDGLPAGGAPPFPSLGVHISAPSVKVICSSIASGVIALTGIDFSLAFIMAKFGTIAYSPRLVLWVARDPVVSPALSVFASTFLYSLLLLAWVDRDTAGIGPFISAWVVISLLLAVIALTE